MGLCGRALCPMTCWFGDMQPFDLVLLPVPLCRPLPGMGALRRGPAPHDVQKVQEVLEKRGSLAIPNNFQPTAPAYHPPGPHGPKPRGRMPTQHKRNPQVRLNQQHAHVAQEEVRLQQLLLLQLLPLFYIFYLITFRH